MRIPFTPEQFFHVFEQYNESVWPVQIIFYLLALVSVAFILNKGLHSNRIILAVLAFYWIWMGIVYHIANFSGINRAAFVFGLFFVIQGVIFLYHAVLNRKIHFEFNLKPSGIIGVVLIAYSLFVYPLLGRMQGHFYPAVPTFGVPCPTTIFTFGILLFSLSRIPWYVIIIPFLWSLIGFSAAVTLGVKEDFGLVIAGIVAMGLNFLKPARHTTAGID
jgi:hypothetical protein